MSERIVTPEWLARVRNTCYSVRGTVSFSVLEDLGHALDEIERLQRILTALREPSLDVMDAATQAFADWDDVGYRIRAAVAAAEREVDA